MAKDNKKKVEQITDMEVDFAQWYTDVCRKAELIDYSSIKGMFIYRPYGYAIWENIQAELDRRFKETGHENVYLPMLIPESLLQKEKDHVEGFAPECAWVTYGGSDPLEERYCIRPTSETLFCEHYKNVIHSHRDLPKLYNQSVLCPALGKDQPPLPAPPGVPVAGGPYHARHRRGGPRGDHADAEHLRGLHGECAGHARGPGRKTTGESTARRRPTPLSA